MSVEETRAKLEVAKTTLLGAEADYTHVFNPEIPELMALAESKLEELQGIIATLAEKTPMAVVFAFSVQHTADDGKRQAEEAFGGSLRPEAKSATASAADMSFYAKEGGKQLSKTAGRLQKVSEHLGAAAAGLDEHKRVVAKGYDLTVQSRRAQDAAVNSIAAYISRLL